MCGGADLLGQLCLRPSKALRRPQIPAPLLQGEIRLQNDHILRPADFHSLPRQFRGVLISAVELPHPAQIAGGEATCFRICGLEIFRGSHRRPFLRPCTDRSADFKVHLYLGQIFRHEPIQRRVHGAVVCRLSDVHDLLLSALRVCYLW